MCDKLNYMMVRFLPSDIEKYYPGRIKKSTYIWFDWNLSASFKNKAFK